VLEGGGGRDAKPEGGAFSDMLSRLEDCAESFVVDQSAELANTGVRCSLGALKPTGVEILCEKFLRKCED
jgi:hypothetical protein